MRLILTLLILLLLFFTGGKVSRFHMTSPGTARNFSPGPPEAMP
jgi:hypothetical protein